MTDASSSSPAEGSGGAGDVIRRYAPMVYGPTAIFAVGEGAVIPLLPTLASEAGADIAAAALVPAALVVGQLCGNLPAGWAVARIGERMTMVIASAVALAGIAAMLLAVQLGMLIGSVLLIGFCASAFGLARHSFMTTRVPVRVRARALSLLGGSFRLGMFTGPFVSAGLLALFGDEHASIWFFGGCLVIVGLLVLFGPDPETAAIREDRLRRAARQAERPGRMDAADVEDTGEPVSGAIPVVERPGVWRTMWRNRGVLARLGLAAASLSAVRSARQAVLPLWGVSIGLDAQTIALIVGISGAVDFALFYASGQVMDRFGRLWASLPSMLIMGVGFIALAFTHDLAASAMWFGVFAIVISVGNGLSSGILMTLGADSAPQHDPAPFLGSWRMLTDAGGALTPLMVAGLAAAFSLSLATGVVGAIGLLGAYGFFRWVPRFVPGAR